MSGFLGTGDPVVPSPGTPGYPNLLASGMTNDPAFQPFQLWAGESDLVTSQGTAGAAMAQFTVVARAMDGHIVPWQGHEGTGATDTVTFSTAVPAAGDSVTINGTAITFRTSGATGYDINIPGSLNATATALAAMVNAHEDVFAATAVAASAVVTLTTTETAGTVTVAKSGTNIAVGGATTTGGTTARKPIGFLAQAAAANDVAVFYTGGVPNHAALVWPASVNTLDLRKAAFDGTNITVSSLL